MTIYIINGEKEVVEIIRRVDPGFAGAIGSAAIARLNDDLAYWTDRLPSGSSGEERSTYIDESGHLITQVATYTAEVRIDGWLI